MRGRNITVCLTGLPDYWFGCGFHGCRWANRVAYAVDGLRGAAFGLKSAKVVDSNGCQGCGSWSYPMNSLVSCLSKCRSCFYWAM